SGRVGCTCCTARRSADGMPASCSSVAAGRARARARSRVSSGRVRASAWPQLEWFPCLSAAVVNRDTPDDEKALLMLGPPHTPALASEVAIDAIVAPAVRVPGPTAL